MNNLNRGIFITIEGIEGVGKSTQLKFLSHYLTQKNIPCLSTREPGGTPIAEEIRKILLTAHEEIMCKETELLLLFAGRAQHVANVIKPALQKGQWVVCDRFTDASFAYQGGGRNIPWTRITEIAKWVLGDFEPDLTLLLDAPVKISSERLQQRGQKDRIEQEDLLFFNAVRQAYLKLAKANPARYRIIQADQSLSAVEQQIIDAISPLLVAA